MWIPRARCPHCETVSNASCAASSAAPRETFACGRTRRPSQFWESEINTAVAQSVFFIPIITPTSVRGPFCQFEFESFLAREQALGRNDLVFPIRYIRVPGLEDDARSQDESVLSMIARRQYVDWREFRHRDVYATQISEAIERLCSKIAEALTRPDPSEVAERQRRQDEIDRQRRREGERQRQQRTRRAAEAERQRRDEELQRQQEERRRRQERALTNGGADREAVVEERQRSSLAERAAAVTSVIMANMAAAERALRGVLQPRSRSAARLGSGLVARVSAQPSAPGGVLRTPGRRAVALTAVIAAAMTAVALGALFWSQINHQEAAASSRTLTGHTNRVETVAFAPAGRTLASGSADNTIKL
jgi:hypothetical protein